MLMFMLMSMFDVDMAGDGDMGVDGDFDVGGNGDVDVAVKR